MAFSDNFSPGLIVFATNKPIVIANTVVAIKSENVFKPIRPNFLTSPRLAAPTTNDAITKGMDKKLNNLIKISPTGLITVAMVFSREISFIFSILDILPLTFERIIACLSE